MRSTARGSVAPAGAATGGTPAAVRVARLLFAGLDIAALCVAITQTTGGLVNFFSFFTIESNIAAIIVLLTGGVLDPGSVRWARLRGAATLLHQVTPIVLLADWIFFPPWPRAERGGTAYWRPLAWLAFPLVYFAYSLSRGAAVDWYPYPFLDPRYAGGYGRVAIYAVVLTVVFTLLALAVSAIGRWRARLHRGTQAHQPRPLALDESRDAVG